MADKRERVRSERRVGGNPVGLLERIEKGLYYDGRRTFTKSVCG